MIIESMVERVARAIACANLDKPDATPGLLHRKLARAAIQAMKYDDWDEGAALVASGQERLEVVGFICAYDRFLDAILAETP